MSERVVICQKTQDTCLGTRLDQRCPTNGDCHGTYSNYEEPKGPLEGIHVKLLDPDTPSIGVQVPDIVLFNANPQTTLSPDDQDLLETIGHG